MSRFYSRIDVFDCTRVLNANERRRHRQNARASMARNIFFFWLDVPLAKNTEEKSPISRRRCKRRVLGLCRARARAAKNALARQQKTARFFDANRFVARAARRRERFC